MISLLLVGHIAVAVLSLGYAAGVISSSKKQQLETAISRTKIMWYGTIATVSSGIGLIFLKSSSVGRSCMALLSFLVIVLVAQVYQRYAFQKSE